MKSFFNQKFSRRMLLFSGISSLAALGFFFKSRIFSRWLEQSTTEQVLFHVDTAEKVIALTIDDGPHETLTAQILDILADHDIKATFFILGDNVPGNEAVLQRLVAEGHELGNHLMNDARSIGLNESEFLEQVSQAHHIISQYADVKWFRPGSGWYNDRMLAQIRPFKYRTVIGSVYPFDAQIRSKEFASSYILSNTQPGSIIILHDGKTERQHTPSVLHKIIPALQKRGFKFLTLSELVEIGENPAPAAVK
ncbi:MAG: chitin deacetylase family protein [Chloroflexota bacterium]